MKDKGAFWGLTGLDVIYYTDVPYKQDGKIKVNEYSLEVGGPAANAAITYSLLGGKSVLFTCLGNNPIAKQIKSMLSSYAVETIDLDADSDITPNISTIVVQPQNGSRSIISGQQSNYEPKSLLLDPNEYSFLLYDCSLAPKLVPLVMNNATTIPLILDVGSWKPELGNLLFYAQDIILSHECKLPPSINLEELAAKLSTSLIATTQGSKPITYFFQNTAGSLEVPQQPKVLDTLAAGDIIHGSFAYYSYLENNDKLNALSKAARVASQSTSYRGPRQGVLEFVKSTNSIEPCSET